MNKTTLMREYICNVLPGMDSTVAAMDTRSLEQAIDAHYEGGLPEWMADYMGRSRTPEKPSQAMLRRTLANALGRTYPVQAHELIVNLYTSGSRVILSLECTIVREDRTRWTETSRTLRMLTFTGPNFRTVEKLEIPDPDFVKSVWCGQYTVVNDSSRFCDKMEQFLMSSQNNKTEVRYV